MPRCVVDIILLYGFKLKHTDTVLQAALGLLMRAYYNEAQPLVRPRRTQHGDDEDSDHDDHDGDDKGGKGDDGSMDTTEDTSAATKQPKTPTKEKEPTEEDEEDVVGSTPAKRVAPVTPPSQRAKRSRQAAEQSTEEETQPYSAQGEIRRDLNAFPNLNDVSVPTVAVSDKRKKEFKTTLQDMFTLKRETVLVKSDAINQLKSQAKFTDDEVSSLLEVCMLNHCFALLLTLFRKWRRTTRSWSQATRSSSFKQQHQISRSALLYPNQCIIHDDQLVVGIIP